MMVAHGAEIVQRPECRTEGNRLRRSGPQLGHIRNDFVLIRDTHRAHASGMATVRTKIEVDVWLRKWLREHDLRPADAVEYGYGCVRLFWKEEKVVLVVDIDDHGDGDGDGDDLDHDREGRPAD